MKASLNPTVLQITKIDNVDVIYLQLRTCFMKIIVGLIYRPQTHNIKKLFDQIIEISNSFESVIFEDFNFPVTSWRYYFKSHMGHDLYTNLLESSLSQHVNKPTRGDHTLDFVFSKNDGLVTNVDMGPEFSTSHHKIVSFNIFFEVYKASVSEELFFIQPKNNFEN